MAWCCCFVDKVYVFYAVKTPPNQWHHRHQELLSGEEYSIQEVLQAGNYIKSSQVLWCRFPGTRVIRSHSHFEARAAKENWTIRMRERLKGILAAATKLHVLNLRSRSNLSFSPSFECPHYVNQVSFSN